VSIESDGKVRHLEQAGIGVKGKRLICYTHPRFFYFQGSFGERRYKVIARKHKDCFLAGEGDVRILMRNNTDEIRAMVKNMVETAKMTGGYMMCVGNQIPWNTPPEAVKKYLDISAELAHR